VKALGAQDGICAFTYKNFLCGAFAAGGSVGGWNWRGESGVAPLAYPAEPAARVATASRAVEIGKQETGCGVLLCPKCFQQLAEGNLRKAMRVSVGLFFADCRGINESSGLR